MNEIDNEHAGIVYYVENGDDQRKNISQKEYVIWLDSYIGSAEELNIEFDPLSEDIFELCSN